MKIECLKEKLAEAVAKVEKITGKNLTLPVLSCILIEAKGHELTLKATNLDLGIEITIPVKVIQEGVVAVPGSILNSLLTSAVGGKNVVLEVVEGNLRVVTEKNTTLIKSLSFDDFPTIPRLTGDRTIDLNAHDFIKGLRSVWYSSASSSMKPELSSVYVYSDGSDMYFVATDSFRLAEKKIKMKDSKEVGSLLIPVKNIPDIMRVLDTVKDSVTVNLDKNQISFTYDGVYLTSRVVDGIFPDYKQIVPKGSKTSITLIKQDLINAIKLATIFSDKFNKLFVSARPADKKLELTTRNADVGENKNVIDAVAEGEDIDINFNYKYITDCFQSIEADSVVLEFNGLNRAMIIKGINDPSFLYLVMPMNK